LVSLALRGHVALPAHVAGGFDHGDVHLNSGRIFVAHTANGTIEVIDGERQALEQTVPGCPEGSGVLCAQGDGGLVFAAARGAGKVLVLDPLAYTLRSAITSGPKPNGLAWDSGRQHLLVADVEDYSARLVDPLSGSTLRETQLPGRPRWCDFDSVRDRFLVNVRDPACVVALAGGTAAQTAQIGVSGAGPHGLDVDADGERAFVACDGGTVVVLDLTQDQEVSSLAIGGEPDAIWFNAARQLLYVAIGQPGLIDVFDCQRMLLKERVTTEPVAHTTAFDARRQLLYVFLAASCRAAVYEQIIDG
jgi:DNA-binding beta-propeller fold protein YncE